MGENETKIDENYVLGLLNGKTEDRLNQLSDFMKDKYDIELYFCQIWGRRWSYFAGRSDIFRAMKKIKLTENMGLVMDSHLPNSVEEKLVKLSKKVLDLI